MMITSHHHGTHKIRIGRSDFLTGGERAYLHPKLMVGPAPEEIYGAVLLTFGP